MDTPEALEHQEFSHYERVYLQMSRAFAAFNREHWSTHCVCSINLISEKDGAEQELHLRNAWKHLALEYPGLTVQPEGNTKSFARLNDRVLEEWAQKTFLVDRSSSADDIIAESRPRLLPGLYYLPLHSEILFISQHWRTDALGCCMLINRYFQLLVVNDSHLFPLPRQGGGVFSPCLEYAAGAPSDEDSNLQGFAREYINAFHARAVNGGNLPFEGDATRAPARTRHQDLTFAIDQSDRIIRACRELSISVSAAIHVALARTYFSFSNTDEKRDAGYTTVMAVNMRPHLQSPYNGPSHACQTYVASITPTVPYASDYLSAARALTAEYREWHTDQWRRSLWWIYKYHFVKLFASRSVPSPSTAEPHVKPRPPSGITLSSLGVVEKLLQRRYGNTVDVLSFRFGVSMMTRQTLLYAWTFRDQLTLSLDYNEAYYAERTARLVLERVRENLLDGLNVGPSAKSEGDG